MHFSSILKNILIAALLCVFLASCGSARRAGRNANVNADGSTKHISKADKKLKERYELLLGYEINSSGLALYKSLDEWLGVPYAYGNATKQGTDCSGFVYNIYKEVYNIEIPRSTDDQFKLLNKVKQEELQEGNLVFFRIEKGKKVSHVGIYLGNSKFVHASSSKGVRIDDLTQEYYIKTYIGGGPVKTE